MRKLIKYLKSLSLFEVVGILIAISIGVIYFMSQYVDDPQDPVTRLAEKTIKNIQDDLGEQRQQQELTRAPNVTGIPEAEYYRLKNALKLKDEQILAITNINAKLKDSMKLVALERDQANNKVWSWEKKTESGSVIKATMNEKDSVLHSDIDVKLNNTDYVDKGGLFGRDKYYTDWYSPDQNIKVNGAHAFRKETIIKPKRFGLGFQAGYGVTEDFKPSLYFGLGVSYNFARF